MTPIWIVITALNEERNIAAILTRLRAMPEISGIVLCDGGSTDETCRLARENGAVVVQASANRGLQLNTGVAAVKTQIDGEAFAKTLLWFLHADAQPHPDSGARLLAACADLNIIGGNFRLQFDHPSLPARLFAQIARLQRRLGIYYGDSGIWVRAEIFYSLGAYPVWPLFEDYDFVRRLERFAKIHRRRTTVIDVPLVTSARRFQTRPWRVLGTWLLFQLLFWLGVSPQRLARMYHGKKR